MPNIILINDQDQEQTLTGVEKLVLRGEDGNNTFVYDPSGGNMVGWKITDYPFSGKNIPGAAAAENKLLNFDFYSLAGNFLTSYSYIHLVVTPVNKPSDFKQYGFMVSWAPVFPIENGMYQSLNLYATSTNSATLYASGDDLVFATIHTNVRSDTEYTDALDESKYTIRGTLYLAEKLENT